MIKVTLTSTKHSNKPFIRIIQCESYKYIKNQNKVSMYATRHGRKNVLIAFAYIDEWDSIIAEDTTGTQVIK